MAVWWAKILKKGAKQALLSAEGYHTLYDHFWKIACRGQEHPKVSKGALRPDFQASTRTRIYFFQLMSPQDTGSQL
jgi:hypothetical protein